MQTFQFSMAQIFPNLVYNLKKGCKFLDRQFDQGLHCLHFCLHLYNILLYG